MVRVPSHAKKLTFARFRRPSPLEAGWAVGDNGRVIASAPVGLFELVGRERETGELKRFVDQLPDGARGVLVRGEPGFGKTMIWRDAVVAAETAGVTVLATRCAEAELPIAFGGLCDLIEAAFGEIADELAEPQRRAIAAALGVEEPSVVVSDSLTLPRAVVAALRLLAARTPVLLAIDDVQWLDARRAGARVRSPTDRRTPDWRARDVAGRAGCV